MTARQITDAILSLTEAYRKLGARNCESASEYATRILTTKKAGQSKKAQFSPDVVSFIGVLLEEFVRHYAVGEGLFEGYCSGMRRNHEDRIGMSFMAYLIMFRYNPIDFGPDAIGPLIFHVTPRTRIAEFILFLSDPVMVLQHAGPFLQKVVQDAYAEDFIVPTAAENAGALKMTLLTPTERGETFEANGDGTNSNNRLGSRSSARGGGSSSARGGNSPMMELVEDDDEDVSVGAYANKTANNNHDDGDSSSPLTRKASASKNAETPLSARAVGAPKFSSPRPPHNSATRALPPAGVREMAFTLPEKRPKQVVTSKATDAELRVVEASKHGVKLSALDDATRAENRAKEEAIPFKPFTAHGRPSNMDRLLEEKRQREREEMTALPPRPTVEEVRRKVNDISEKVEVKTTKAALKRELALVNKKREEEEARFAQRLAALRDDTEFRDWQVQGRHADEAEKLRQMQQRRLDAMLADEEARQSRVKQVKLKQAESRVVKDAIEEQRDQLRKEHVLKQYELTRQAEEQRQQLAADVAVAVEAVQKAKREAVEEVKVTRQENEVKMAMQAELERRRKVEMIQNIKRMQKESAELRREAIIERQKAAKMVNYTSVTDDGASLFHVPTEEMSLVDLKKLLYATNKEQERLLEEKRLRILAEREAEKQNVRQMEAVVLQHRDKAREEKEAKREEKRQHLTAAQLAAKAKEEEQIQTLQAKLAQRREERRQNEAAIREGERRRIVAAQLLMKDSKAVEKKKLEQIEKAAENTVIAAQNARLRENKVRRAISANESAKREDNLNSAQRKLQDARALSDQINEEKRTLQRQENIHDALVRKALYAEVGVASQKW